jgi:hypothetical protein
MGIQNATFSIEVATFLLRFMYAGMGMIQGSDQNLNASRIDN